MNSFLVGKAGWASASLARALGGSMGSRGGGENMSLFWGPGESVAWAGNFGHVSQIWSLNIQFPKQLREEV